MKSLAFVLLAVSLSGCVTINIYFPAAAAEKAADKLIEEIWQLKNGARAPAVPPAASPKNEGGKP